MVPLSNVLEVMMSTTAMSRSRRFFQIDRRIARPHAQGRLAGAIGGFDRARSAGGVDQADVFVMHQVGVVRQRWAIPGR